MTQSQTNSIRDVKEWQDFIKFILSIDIFYMMTYFHENLERICWRNRQIRQQVLGTHLLKLRLGRGLVE